jgi:cytochrome P450
VEDAVTPDPDDLGYWAVVKYPEIDLLPPYFLEFVPVLPCHGPASARPPPAAGLPGVHPEAGQAHRGADQGLPDALHAIAKDLIDARGAKPADDLLRNLVQAEIEGEKLSDFEIGSFFVLLSVAGTDTTKHTSAFTVEAMTEFPDQRDWLREDYDGRTKYAVEEFVRYASPVMTFRRTATRETELGGKKIIPGDKVVSASATSLPNRCSAHCSASC